MLKTQVSSVFKQRREKLVRHHPDAVYVFAGHPLFPRNDDVDYPFRQDSSFFYLTGFDEPNAWLVLVPQSGGPGTHKSVLFVQERNALRELWDGERYGPEGAVRVFGVDEAYVNTEFDSKLLEYLKASDNVFFRWGQQPECDRRVMALIERFRSSLGRSNRSLHTIHDPKRIIGELRFLKDAEEVAAMRRAGEISAHAHKIAMQKTRPGLNESHIEAIVDFEMRYGGCQRMGYGSIVAGGKNATCLHYHSNNETLRDGDLLLIDAGGEFNYYTADITRTFPVGKKFSNEQAKLYDLVLEAQLACLKAIRPGIPYSTMHETATQVLTDGLMKLGLLKDAKDIKRFFPHGTGHFLGLDVHDAGLYKVARATMDRTPQMPGEESRMIVEGMAFTVEPGIYCQPNDTEVPPAYRGIGIRIEDDIVVTANGCEILTSGVPKTRAEIEALRS